MIVNLSEYAKVTSLNNDSLGKVDWTEAVYTWLGFEHDRSVLEPQPCESNARISYQQ